MIPVVAICTLTLVLAGCEAANEAPLQNNQSSSSTNASAQTASTQNDRDKSEETMEASTMYITANGNHFEVELTDNSSTKALVNLLEKGPITYTANDYGNFEKVGDIGCTLPTNDTQINTVPGDVILYQGNKICIYYAKNSWSFTRIGKITNASNLKERLGNGPVKVTLSLD